jgi:hypothetical protein
VVEGAKKFSLGVSRIWVELEKLEISEMVKGNGPPNLRGSPSIFRGTLTSKVVFEVDDDRFNVLLCAPNVLVRFGFVIIYKDRCGGVHGIHEAQSIADAALGQAGVDLAG